MIDHFVGMVYDQLGKLEGLVDIEMPDGLYYPIYGQKVFAKKATIGFHRQVHLELALVMENYDNDYLLNIPGHHITIKVPKFLVYELPGDHSDTPRERLEAALITLKMEQ